MYTNPSLTERAARVASATGQRRHAGGLGSDGCSCPASASTSRTCPCSSVRTPAPAPRRGCCAIANATRKTKRLASSSARIMPAWQFLAAKCSGVQRSLSAASARAPADCRRRQHELRNRATRPRRLRGRTEQRGAALFGLRCRRRQRLPLWQVESSLLCSRARWNRAQRNWSLCPLLTISVKAFSLLEKRLGISQSIH